MSFIIRAPAVIRWNGRQLKNALRVLNCWVITQKMPPLMLLLLYAAHNAFVSIQTERRHEIETYFRGEGERKKAHPTANSHALYY